MKENIGYSDVIISDKAILLWDELFNSFGALLEYAGMEDMQWIEEAHRHCKRESEPKNS